MSSQNSIDLFNTEWKASIAKFQSIAGLKSLNIDLKHPQTKQPMTAYQQLPDLYDEWMEIRSTWDKESLFFSVIYDLVGQYMQPWQVANYLTIDRNAFQAFDILTEASQGNVGEDYSSHCASLAKSLCSLTYFDESLVWAKKACQAEPNNSHFKIVLADAHFLSGDCDRACKMYDKCVSSIPKSLSESVGEMFLATFSIEHGVVPSPIFAIQLGRQLSDPQQSAEFWKLSEAEFYYSPYFRAEHAYHLASKGRNEECLAKLITLVQEMPWLQEASINLKSLFDCFNQNGNRIMPDFQQELSERIKERGWKGKGIFAMATY
ncbi:hypothetical protein [Chamaesiphon polymorphus]|uniref:Tetratricopeptide repeat protein n=1 Tax=Chamaesiphon polymorphus CCALA 037 TaxID=2107692 RepID=A0A2T1GEF0_9CYAN|nr:hypothetical protein [Chamaesiphon polymorphus]PSB55830.1 hypothetical protein C7B77_13780 [Chamaesiphon polymorphus CCALA 037]